MMTMVVVEILRRSGDDNYLEWTAGRKTWAGLAIEHVVMRRMIINYHREHRKFRLM